MSMRGENSVGEEDRLKSVPPPALSDARDEQGGARSVPAQAPEQSAAVKVALGALRIYKVYLSVLFAGSCRFEPTCSMYAYGAIERFGVIRGSWMGLKRLLQCHPLSRKFGYDPVPEKMEVTPSESSASPRGAHS
jgi:uncharacterized protein